MKFRNINIEICGIKEVRIDGDLYSRITGDYVTNGGKKVTVKFFKREKDGYCITEDKFMKKLQRLQNATQCSDVKAIYYRAFGEQVAVDETRYINKWRFWFSEGTLNVDKILI